MSERGDDLDKDGGDAADAPRMTARSRFRRLWFAGGMICLALGGIGAVLPVMPTVIFLIGAAACFARSNPAWEARVMQHPVFGPHVRAWRERRAITRIGKWWATLGLLGGAAFSLFFVPMPWGGITPALAALLLPWIWTRVEV